MPQIPETDISALVENVVDIKESMQAVVDGMLLLNERTGMQIDMAAKIIDILTVPSETSPLTEILKGLIDADQRHAVMLQQILAAVRKL